MNSELTNDDLIKTLEEGAKERLFVSGHCAQSSFSVLDEQFELEGEMTLKALTPFPGIALRGETCGAVVGSLMALGIVYGRDDLSDFSGFRRALRPARAFCRRFEDEMGSTMCGNILEKELGKRYDLAHRAEFAEYLSCGGPETCARVVSCAVRIAAELILEGQEMDSGE